MEKYKPEISFGEEKHDIKKEILSKKLNIE